MQVNMISISSIPETPVKQDSKESESDSSFKSAVNSAIQKSKDNTAESKKQIQKSNEPEDDQEIKEDDNKGKTKDKDLNENLTSLLSELLSGKIDFSELTTSIKNDIQSLIKSKITISGVDDNKLSDAVTKLFNNLIAGQDELNSQNKPKLPDNEVKTPLSKFNDEIVKLLQGASTSINPDKNTVSKVIKAADESILQALKTESINANSLGASSDHKDILYALKTMINSDENNPKSKLIEQDTDAKVNINDTGSTYKINQSSSGQNLKTVTQISSNEEKAASNSEDKNQNLNSSEGDGFLKNLISGDKNSKFSKVSNFMTQFNSIKADVPVTQNESITINKATFTNDMFKAVKYMESDGIKDLTVKIMPKELGEVLIKLTMENGVMKANITTSNKDTYNLLNSSIKDISDKLQDSNIKIQNFNINVYNEDTTFFKDKSNGQNREGYNQKQNSNSVKEIDSEEVTDDNLALKGDSEINVLI